MDLMNFLSIISVIFSIVSTILIGSAIRRINSNWSFKNYSIATSFIVSTIWIYFLTIRALFNIVKIFIGDNHYLTNYFYMFLAIMFITLLLGYYYISELSDNKLKDFLLILSLAFVNSFAVVSAMKSIPKIN
ncbi:MAG: hypothetical protein AABX28_01700 [Nanoarchaeota archaeon]